MDNIICHPIGIVHSPHKRADGTPVQSAGVKGVGATIGIFPEHVDDLKDLKGFSHFYVLYHLHLAHSSLLQVIPFPYTQQYGVFATRLPGRSNRIGLSVVQPEKVEYGILYIWDVDMLDGSPVLDIKPYVPEFDVHDVSRYGWLEGKTGRLSDQKDDGRFGEE